jgi:hypothetical protein
MYVLTEYYLSYKHVQSFQTTQFQTETVCAAPNCYAKYTVAAAAAAAAAASNAANADADASNAADDASKAAAAANDSFDRCRLWFRVEGRDGGGVVCVGGWCVNRGGTKKRSKDGIMVAHSLLECTPMWSRQHSNICCKRIFNRVKKTITLGKHVFTIAN